MVSATALGAFALLVFGIAPVPALADVKDGVEAWDRGDYDAAVAQWRGPADKGDADAMFNMGQAYKMGRGVAKDLDKAESFYRRAAQKGHVRAADNLGILLFQTSRQSEAIPLLEASARRGEPRAMYVLAIAAYNGDYAPRDWVRAYALMSRASGAGLQQANTSLAAMDEAIPLDQRQQGVALAQQMDQQATAARASDMSGADLGAAPPVFVPASPPPSPPAASLSAAPPPVRIAAAPALRAVPAPASRPVPDAPVMAGADYADPVALPRSATTKPPPPKSTAPRPDGAAQAVAKPAPAPRPETRPVDARGGWRIQFGAFGQKSNADALWARLHVRPEIAGHARIDSPGAVSRLQAGGYSEAAARAACGTLKAAGQTCLVVNH